MNCSVRGKKLIEGRLLGEPCSHSAELIQPRIRAEVPWELVLSSPGAGTMYACPLVTPYGSGTVLPTTGSEAFSGAKVRPQRYVITQQHSKAIGIHGLQSIDHVFSF
jgi:hypothetical protein